MSRQRDYLITFFFHIISGRREYGSPDGDWNHKCAANFPKPLPSVRRGATNTKFLEVERGQRNYK